MKDKSELKKTLEEEHIWNNLNSKEVNCFKNELSEDFLHIQKEKSHNMANCMLSILDSLKLYDKGGLLLDEETLSEMMFRKMKGYNIDLNEELGFTHLKPVRKI